MAKPAAATNDFDPEVVQEILAKIDGLTKEIVDKRTEMMRECRSIHESVSNCYKEAKARGIPTKELRALVKIRANETKNRELYNALEADQQQTLSMLATAEGVKDLPLWRAAQPMAAQSTAHH
ncbi:MAG TPA: GapR family DNA-binding domain-containing protein [Candidatus Saccharimonadales bacterium]|nr:GapR family DNA-binding domain-containing protein [Candidatus Saccharimonadales bacterium]